MYICLTRLFNLNRSFGMGLTMYELKTICRKIKAILCIASPKTMQKQRNS